MPDAGQCHALWRAVLAIGIQDALGFGRQEGSGTSKASQQVLFERRANAWLGGSDFRQVCDFAALEPDAVLSLVARRRRHMETPPATDAAAVK